MNRLSHLLRIHMTVRAFRFVNDICLNDKEFLLDEEDGEILLFETTQDAIDYLMDNDVPAKTEDEFMELGIYFEVVD